jgi:acyl transferase domain-containing protein/acyl carrier protein
MSDFLARISNLSPRRLALLALEQHEQIEAATRRTTEPIAVIGIGCRYPGGANDPDSYWQLLREGRDAISEVPHDRWDIDALFDPDPDVPARMSVRSGGFLADIGSFDPGFFGIAPREALSMDPQQRLLLEVTWEALEHACIAPESLSGSATGVFVGICNADHFNRLLHRGADQIDGYLASGNAHSVASGRIAYCLGLQGPALSIDTACSSSLVALHVACRSVRSGESRLAIVAGVNVMCSPETTIALSKAHMLAPDGRCKTFDASANGFSRGEGCGVLILKRQQDAIADGDRVLALIRGTAVNQDGRSGGLTVPNGPAQEAVIRLALADAGVQGAEIDYVEAHGTGTSLGDPIEVRALAGALGGGRSAEKPLLIGSVKTNFGHLESAAGIAGVIKVVLGLQHQRIPPHLHFKVPNPHIAWSDYPVKVESQGVAWLRSGRPRLAGVSSFGFSGTNAHVVLEEAAIEQPSSGRAERPLHCLPLSAKSADALRGLAGLYAGAFSKGAADTYVDMVNTAGTGRSHFSERAAIVAGTAADATTALRALQLGEAHPALHTGSSLPGQPPDIVFLFTGQGSQYPGMAQSLYADSAIFREVIDHCDSLLGADAQGRTLKSILWSSVGDDTSIHETAWTQPALFAVEYGLVQVWRSWGIEPAAVIGHSVGEYVAACVAGVFTLDEGLQLIAKRGRLMQSRCSGGSMAALFASLPEVAAAVAPLADKVAIAAINAADSIVISGQSDAVEEILAAFERRDVRGQRLAISVAAHSPLVDAALDSMQALAAQVTMHAPSIPIAWNLTGGKALASASAPDAMYWRRHMREPVRFAEGVAELHAKGFRRFLEVGPHPTLSALAMRSLPQPDVGFVSSLRRGKNDWSEMLTGLAKLYVCGAQVDWQAINGPYAGARAVLPCYPFERRTYWTRSTAAASTPRRRHATATGNALRVERLPTAAPIFQSTLTPSSPAYLAQHKVQGVALVPGPVFIELAQMCAAEATGKSSALVTDFEIFEPLVLPEAGRTVEIHLSDLDTGAFTVHSQASDGEGIWSLHAAGKLAPQAGGNVQSEIAPVPLDVAKATLTEGDSCAARYAWLSTRGVELAGAFACVREARYGEGEALVRLELPADSRSDPVSWAHPGLIDGAVQSVGFAMKLPAEDSDLYLFTGLERLLLNAPLPATFWCHAKLRDSKGARPAEWKADVTLRASDGASIGELRGVRLRRASHDALQRGLRGAGATTAVDTLDKCFYELTWAASPADCYAAATWPASFNFAASLPGAFERFSAEHGMDIYSDLLPELDRLCISHICAAFKELGFEGRAGRSFSADGEANHLGIAARHRRLFSRVLDMLTEDGLLRRQGTNGSVSFEVTEAFMRAPDRLRYEPLFERFGAIDGELRTLQRCATELGDVLRGSRDPLHLLFPDGSLSEARQLYVESPYARTYNSALAHALQGAIAALPPDARLRVLEIGGGTGGTTGYVLPLLPAGRVEFTFTDISPLFLERASQQFKEHAFIRYTLLDIEREPDIQGFQPGQYDLIIAANVLHATSDLSRTLGHVHSLLASDGLLLLLEGVAPERWADLTFGMTEGWWRFTDTNLRSGYPLIARDKWRALLQDMGFSEVETYPDGEKLSRAMSQHALIVARATKPRRPWVLIGDLNGWGAALAAELRARAEHVTLIAADDFEAELPLHGELVYLGALELVTCSRDDRQAVSAAERLSCEWPVRWLARLAAQPTGMRAWLVTQGAQAVADELLPSARWQAPLWGVGRVFALEHPAHWGALLDMSPDDAAGTAADLLLSTIQLGDSEDQVAFRDDTRHVARLLPMQAPEVQTIAFRSDATYLVTGGFGGLGLLIARWMADNGARHIALLGRTDRSNCDAVQEMKAMGVDLIVLVGDVADESAMAAHFARLAECAPPLRGVIHAASDSSAAAIVALDPAQIQAMLRPKIEGTVLLERMTQSLDLDFMVLFSSTTALLGAQGLAHYAAANTFLDATAESSNSERGRVYAVNWGTWEYMRQASAESQRKFQSAGLQPMAAADALRALGTILAGDRAHSIIARINWNALKSLHQTRRLRPMLLKLGDDNNDARPSTDEAAGNASTSLLSERLANASEQLRSEILIEFVRSEVAGVLGIEDGDNVAMQTGLFELGMDSLMSVELRRRLERGSGRNLPSTLTFNYPNVAALSAFLYRQFEFPSGPVASTAAPERSIPAPMSHGDLDALSDEQLEARLMARLEATR